MDTLRHILQLIGGQAEPGVFQVLIRLVVAAILGGLIGLEREMKHRPAGLRTNMFICFGSAMFTVLSDRFAGHFGGDHARIAAQIIPGIGFIGAGSILRERGSITGLTTAATIFVVASVGMAAGGGFYLFAIFATGVILLALFVLGQLERRFHLKATVVTYEVIGGDASDLFTAVSTALQRERHAAHGLQLTKLESEYRLQFSVEATPRQHRTLTDNLRRESHLRSVESFGAQESE
jgi:putative Mg2+ transporter-C (MgtC) family protein